jgi:hypothetical protein
VPERCRVERVALAVAEVEAGQVVASTKAAIRVAGNARMAGADRDDLHSCFGQEQIEVHHLLGHAEIVDDDRNVEEIGRGQASVLCLLQGSKEYWPVRLHEEDRRQCRRFHHHHRGRPRSS